MKLKTKIINEDTKECLIINQIEAVKLDLEELEVQFTESGKCFLLGFAPKKSIEEQLQEVKEIKIQELKSKRDKHLINNNYEYSENDKFNIINLIGYTEEEKNKYLEFIKELKTQYDEYKELINTATTINKLNKIIIEFNSNLESN